MDCVNFLFVAVMYNRILKIKLKAGFFKNEKLTEL